MYQVWECYHAQGNPTHLNRKLGAFDELEQAKSFAEASYRHLAKIPESERMSVCVVAPDKSIPYSMPMEH